MRRTPQEALAWSVPWPHDYVDDIGKEGDRGDTYIMMKCLSVTKNHHFLKWSVNVEK